MFPKHVFILKLLERKGPVSFDLVKEHVGIEAIRSCHKYGYIQNHIARKSSQGHLQITGRGLSALAEEKERERDDEKT